MRKLTNVQFQSFILFTGIVIALVKFGLYFFTKSNAVFSDALESLVNITANLITLYSLYHAAKPKDLNHPYGHGKLEFIASGIEGTLLCVAGLLTWHKSVGDYLSGSLVHITGLPLIIIMFLGFSNYLLGYLSDRRGRAVNSPALISGGRHLKGDGYTSFAILLSLIIIYFTKWTWMDTIIALIAGMYIMYQGVKVVKQSLLDILDTADEKILGEIIQFIQKNRDAHWIDLHNFRIIKYGSEYHVDAHLTLPFYYTNLEVHREMKEVHDLINKHFNSEVEIFIHPDPCEPFCCHYCMHQTCKERSSDFKGEVVWTPENVLKNEKHRYAD